MSNCRSSLRWFKYSLDVFKRGYIVLDPFMGSVGTLVADERSGRIARGLKIDLAYFVVILGCWQKETGSEPS